MKIVKTIDEVRSIVKGWRAEGLTVGLVPTMGYLHEGHASLIDASHRDNDRTVVSDFVNPMQFGPTEDLESYPRDLERDAALAEAHGADIIFNPEPSEMYHEGFSSFVDMTVLTQERTQPPRTFPRSVHGGLKAFQHSKARPRIFRQKGRAAACSYPPHG